MVIGLIYFDSWLIISCSFISFIISDWDLSVRFFCISFPHFESGDASALSFRLFTLQATVKAGDGAGRLLCGFQRASARVAGAAVADLGVLAKLF